MDLLLSCFGGVSPFGLGFVFAKSVLRRLEYEIYEQIQKWHENSKRGLCKNYGIKARVFARNMLNKNCMRRSRNRMHFPCDISALQTLYSLTRPDDSQISLYKRNAKLGCYIKMTDLVELKKWVFMLFPFSLYLQNIDI